MICLGSSKEVRIQFLDWYKTQCKNLPRFLKKTKVEVLNRMHYTPGFFSPGGFLSRAEIIAAGIYSLLYACFLVLISSWIFARRDL